MINAPFLFQSPIYHFKLIKLIESIIDNLPTVYVPLVDEKIKSVPYVTIVAISRVDNFEEEDDDDEGEEEFSRPC